MATKIIVCELDNANLNELNTTAFELFNMIYINYYFGGHFNFVHDLRNSIYYILINIYYNVIL